MRQNEKINYVKEWVSYIKPMYALAFTNDPEISKEVDTILKRLIELVPLVADDKIKGQTKEVIIEKED